MLYDSPSLLGMFNRKSGRPAADAMTDASKYQRLSESQNRVVAMIAGIAPWSLYPKSGYSSLPTMTTADNQVFTFGLDSNGYAIVPMGKAGIYRSRSDVPDYPMIEGYDYLNEGSQIRIPNNRTYSATLYWRGVQQPADITASGQPTLIPEASRELIVIDAVRQFATENARNLDLAAAMAAEWNAAWPTWLLVLKTQFRAGGALGTFTARQISMSA